ncbi:MAG: hypothetical protein ABIJ93_04795 [candidate division WOR-3 bacterium]
MPAIEKLRAGYLSFVLIPFCLLYAQNIIWSRTFDSGRFDYTGQGGVDPCGNLIFVGQIQDSWLPIHADLIIIKYSPAGETLWVRTFDSGENDELGRCAININGDIVIAGTCSPPAHCLLLKYDRDGNLVWCREDTIGPVSYRSYLSGVLTDESLNIYVTGTVTRAPVGEDDWLVMKYDADGNLIWRRILDSGNNMEGIDQIIAHPDGNIVGLGTVGDWNHWIFDFFVVKFDRKGDTIWTRRLDVKNEDWGADLTVDADGNIYFTGDAQEYLNGWIVPDSCVVGKYHPGGTLEWVQTFGVDDVTAGFGIANSESHGILIAGSGTDTLTQISRGLIACYKTDGTLLWHWTYRQENWNCWFTDIVIAEPGVCYVIGEVASADYDSSDFLVLKLRYPVGVAEGRPAEVPAGDISPATMVCAGATLRFSVAGAGCERAGAAGLCGLSAGRREPHQPALAACGCVFS